MRPERGIRDVTNHLVLLSVSIRVHLWQITGPRIGKPSDSNGPDRRTPLPLTNDPPKTVGLRRSLHIRRATADDLPAVAAIQVASPESAQWNPSDYLDHEFLVAIAGN